MDRNSAGREYDTAKRKSLSARRAWIEIILFTKRTGKVIKVALRKESVDRNRPASHLSKFNTPSLSARRAWIEMINSR